MTQSQDSTAASLLPWVANGTLSEPETVQLQQFLRENPQAFAQLELWQAVRAAIRREGAESAPVDFAWRRFQWALRREQKRPRPRWAYWAAAASVIFTIAIPLGIALRQPAGEVYAPLADGRTAALEDAWILQLRFHDGATAAQIATLLGEHGGNIVDGPSAVGVYQVALRPGEYFTNESQALATLRAAPIVLQASVPP